MKNKIANIASSGFSVKCANNDYTKVNSPVVITGTAPDVWDYCSSHILDGNASGAKSLRLNYTFVTCTWVNKINYL